MDTILIYKNETSFKHSNCYPTFIVGDDRITEVVIRHEETHNIVAFNDDTIVKEVRVVL